MAHAALEPPLETADIETSSDDYARRFSGAAGEWMLSVQERIVRKLIDGQTISQVLDVGGGHGQLARPLAAAGYQVTVLGSDESCQARLRDLVHEKRVTFRVGSVVAVPFPARAFDLVTSIRLLPHCTAWETLVGELCRVSSRFVLVDYPTSQSVNALSPLLFGAKKGIEKNTRPYTLFPHAQVDAAFAVHGFRRVARIAEFFFPMVLHRLLKAPVLSGCLEQAARVVGATRLLGSPVVALYESKTSARPGLSS